jgi:large subunit ribosomal protein L17
VTTKVRAKLTQVLVNQLVTMGKDINSIAARRRAFAVLNDHNLVHKLFSEIAPMFSEKKGGYTRIIPYKRRRGDNAEMVVLELSVQKVVAAPKKDEKKKAKGEPKPETRPELKPEAKPESKAEHKEAVPPEKDKHKRETKKPANKAVGGFQKFFKPKRVSE